MGTFYDYNSYICYVSFSFIYGRYDVEKKKRVMYTSGKFMVAMLGIFYVSLLIYMYNGGDGE